MYPPCQFLKFPGSAHSPQQCQHPDLVLYGKFGRRSLARDATNVLNGSLDLSKAFLGCGEPAKTVWIDWCKRKLSQKTVASVVVAVKKKIAGPDPSSCLSHRPSPLERCHRPKTPTPPPSPAHRKRGPRTPSPRPSPLRRKRGLSSPPNWSRRQGKPRQPKDSSLSYWKMAPAVMKELHKARKSKIMVNNLQAAATKASSSSDRHSEEASGSQQGYSGGRYRGNHRGGRGNHRGGYKGKWRGNTWNRK